MGIPLLSMNNPISTIGFGRCSLLTPYILNAIDVSTRLVIGQLAIREKTNEMTAIPELDEMLEIEGSTITVDAIGTTGSIMNTIDEKDGYFLLQVKKNCPLLYDELMDLFMNAKEMMEIYFQSSFCLLSPKCPIYVL